MLEVSIHTYTRTGELNDEQIISDEEHPDCDKPFYGRPKEKIRFKPGDIVEVWQGGISELNIVCALPWTPQEVEKRNLYVVSYRRKHCLDKLCQAITQIINHSCDATGQ